jgi:hypothetical protein
VSFVRNGINFNIKVHSKFQLIVVYGGFRDINIIVAHILDLFALNSLPLH